MKEPKSYLNFVQDAGKYKSNSKELRLKAGFRF